MGFRKGGEGAKEEAARSGGNFARTHYLSIEKDDSIVLRYLTDSPDWIYVDQHASVPTKNKPRDFEGNWPSSMPAVCRKDKGFEGKYGDDCYVCNSGLKNQWGKPIKPTLRVWALACIREEVIGTKEMVEAGEIEQEQVGKRIGFKDAVREIDEKDEKGESTGKTIQERAIIVVNQAPSNYFNGLQSMFGIYKTVCDRDYVVTRTGDGTDTDYDHIPLDKTDNLQPGKDRWKKYEESVKQQGLDLEKIIESKADDEYFALFFDPDKTPPSRGKKGESSGKSDTPPTPPETSNDVDEDRLAAMRDRVRSHSGKQASMADVD